MIGTFWDHAEELRKTLVAIVITIFLGFLLSFIFYQPLMHFFCKPYNNLALHVEEVRQKRIYGDYYTLSSSEELLSKAIEVKPGTYKIPDGESLLVSYTVKPKLKLFDPLEGMITALKVSLWTSIALTSPIWLYFILTFIAPALRKETLGQLRAFWISSFVLFFSGLLFAWSVSIPWANQVLQNFNEGLGENVWRFGYYIDYTLVLLLATATAFEGVAILLFLVHLGICKAAQLRKFRRHAIVAIFIISAILTPPDVLTQFLLAIPLMFLYECVILYALICARRHTLDGRDHLANCARDLRFQQTLPKDL